MKRRRETEKKRSRTIRKDVCKFHEICPLMTDWMMLALMLELIPVLVLRMIPAEKLTL